MAPAKSDRDKYPQTRPGVTGFVQEYNETPPQPSDLNPDVVTEDSVLPTPQAREDFEAPKRKRGRKAK